MAGLRFSDLHARPTELLDLTSLTLEEFHCLVPAFETAFYTRMATGRLDGKLRTARRFSVYTPCPLPTPEDRLLFILVYLKTSARQVVQERLFGMGQRKATQWIHVLLPVRRAAFEALGDGPTRTLATLAQGLSVAAAIVVALLPRAEPDPPPLPAPSTSVAAPLLPTMGPKGGSIAPKIRLSRSAVIAARRRATP
jgi:hypothetical protein